MLNIKKIIRTLTCAASATLLWSHAETCMLKKTCYEIVNDKLPDFLSDKKVALLSDYHVSNHQISNKRIMRMLDEIDPLFVLIPGDMIVGNSENIEPAIKLLEEISAKYKVYLSPGNHERKMERLKDKYGSTIERFVASIPDNCTYLSNEKTTISVGDERLDIYGLNINLSFYQRFKYQRIPQDYIVGKLGNPDSETYSILMAHNPDYFRDYVKWKADLVVSGHNHGGIARLPYLGGVISPRMILFPEYDKGYFKKGDTDMILTSGIGQHSIKLRFNNKPEICEIKFTK